LNQNINQRIKAATEQRIVNLEMIEFIFYKPDDGVRSILMQKSVEKSLHHSYIFGIFFDLKEGVLWLGLI